MGPTEGVAGSHVHAHTCLSQSASATYGALAKWCLWFSEHPNFVNFVTFIIICAGVMVGIQTYDEIVEQHETLLFAIDWFILGVFIIECTVKIIAQEVCALPLFCEHTCSTK